MLTGERTDVNDIEVREEPVVEKARELANDSLSVYLSGPIRHMEDSGVGWRESIIDEYGDRIGFLSPLDNFSPEEVEIIHDPENFDPDSDEEQVLPDEYITQDKIDIMRSDCLLVGLPDVKSRGTLMEVMWGWDRNVPFYVWEMNNQTESGWLYDHGVFVSDDLDEVINRILENHE